MARTIYNYRAGDSATFVIAVKDSSGDALDLTGATVKFKVGALEKTAGSGLTVTNAAAGVVTVTISPGDLEAGWYGYELQVVQADATSYTPVWGYLQAEQTLYPSE